MSDGVKVTNLSAFDAQVEAWFAAVEKAAAEAAVGLAKRVFDKVLIESPQYSGDFAANWQVSVDAPSSRFTVGVLKPKLHGYADSTGIHGLEPFKRGDPEAITYAKSHAVWPTIKLGQTIYLSNSANHDEDYAWKIEDGTIKFRPVTQGADHVGARSLNFVAHRYPVINKSALAILRRVGV